MTLVVDASVRLKWFLAEPGSAAAEVVGSRNDLVAPDLILAEVTNGLWRATRQGRLSVADGGAAARHLVRAFARLVESRGLVERAFDVACTLDHPAYDCLYLVLAEREAATLVTADRRLVARHRHKQGRERPPPRRLRLRVPARLGSGAAPVYGPGKR